MSDATPAPEPRPEAVAAAGWWADALATPTRHDMGDPSADVMARKAAKLGARTYTAGQVEAFRGALAIEIEKHLAKHSWRVEEPDWGAYSRAVAHDYRPAEVLETAAEAVGIKVTLLDLPMKTTMWINPGVVKVAAGHGVGIVTVWQRED